MITALQTYVSWIEFQEIKDIVRPAANVPKNKQFQNAINEELQSFTDRIAWELIDRPLNKTEVKSQLVLNPKEN